MLDALDSGDWPSDAAKADAATRAILSANRFYSTGDSDERVVIPWPDGLADQVYSYLKLSALSDHDFTTLALEAGLRPRPELLAWFRQHFTHDQIRERLHPNVLKRVDAVLLAEPTNE